MRTPASLGLLVGVIWAVGPALPPTSYQPRAHAGYYVELGPSDGLALDQPRVAVEVIDVPDDGPPVSLGPEFYNTVLLDTGANAILVVGPAATELASAGCEIVAVYDEQGVAGTTPMDVTASYRFDFAGDSGERWSLPDVRLMSNQSLNFGGFNGILGMPAMVGRNTTVDMTGWYVPWFDPLSNLYLGVDFSAQPPPAGDHRYTVPLQLVDFPQSGQRHPDDPLPTWAPLPSAEVNLRHGLRRVNSQFIVDTGAQISIINSSTALALGLDADGSGSFDEEKLYDLEVGGIGGTVDMPVLAVDALAVVTEEEIDLMWTDLTVGVLDIDPAIAGVFGMDFLTSGWLERFFVGTGDGGYVERVHFDFRAADQMSGKMLLDINPALDQVMFAPSPGDMDGDGQIGDLDVEPFVHRVLDGPYHPAADMNGDGVVNGQDIDLFVAAARGPAVPGDVSGDGRLSSLDVNPFLDSLLGGPYHPAADMNGDGVVNGLDVDPFVAAVAAAGGAATGAATTVPEPSALALCGIVLMCLVAMGRARPGNTH